MPGRYRAATLRVMTATGTERWRALLCDSDAARAVDIAEHIGDELAAAEGTDASLDLFTPVLDAHLAIALDSDRHADRALNAVAHRFGRTAALSSPALYGGLAGLGWMAAHVTNILGCGIEADEIDPLEEIDRTLNEIAAHRVEKYDLISGLAGIGAYAFERMPRDQAQALLERIIDRLAGDAETMPAGVTWYTPAHLLPEHQRKVAPHGYYNLGVAHGTPALAVTLARAVSAGIRTDVARRLLNDLMRWIFGQRSSAGIGGRFASWVPKDLPPAQGNSREAWCYGGLGLSVALLNAARIVGDLPSEELALDVARLEAARPIEHSGVNDMCLCHGGAGNAHLYNRLYQATGEDVFLDAARKWLHVTLNASRPRSGVGGYLFWTPNESGIGTSLTPEPTFLSGSAGVGLALLAASTTCNPSWDRLLLADVPFG